ncbi:MAG: hypothetical protein AAGC95_17790 [Pseudomonadota bacterium]
MGKALAHGVTGGVFSEINGGSFESGFLAAGFSSLAGIAYRPNNLAVGTAYHAVVGGIGAELGGGKFKDGATTGAFVYLFNDAQERRIRGKIQEAVQALSDFIGTDLVAAGDDVLNAIDAQLPKFARTVFFGASFSAAAGPGGTFGNGSYWDRVTGEVGYYDQSGWGGGINIGATPIAGFITGSAQEFCCYFEAYEASYFANFGYLRGLEHKPSYGNGRYSVARNGVFGGYIGGGELGAGYFVTYTELDPRGVRN